ncbi:MAG: glycosyltransferase family 4 protein, partial [Patescibacteria group bacterium]|nr:glycosyltransferase family 4 protein [Patescibacteria group bacterium]
MSAYPQKTIAFITSYFPPQTGGVERYVYEVAKRLEQSSGAKIIVITSGEKSGVDQKEIYNDLTVYRLGYQLKISNSPFSLRWFGALKKILKEEQPDIVNIHLPVPGLGDIASFFVEKKKLVVTYHGLSMHKGSLPADIVIWLYEHVILPIILKRARRIICSSDTVRNEFFGAYTHKSVTIPPAVDPTFFSEQGGEKRPENTLLFVAAQLNRACEYKGLPLLIDALKEIHRRGIEARLVVVGDGDMRAHYEARVQELGLKDFVQFKGRLYGRDLQKAYKEASIFVLPTMNDSYPTVILEAMMSGLPVVSSMVGDIPTMVEDGVQGYLVPPNNMSVLVEKLLLLLNNRAQAEAQGVAARSKVMSGFGWEDRAARYQHIFDSLLIERRPIVHCLGYYPPHMGGMEQRVQELAMRLAERGEDVTVLTSSIGAKRGRDLERKVKVFYLNAVEVANTPIAPGLFFRLLMLPKGSILHLHVAQAFFPEIVGLVAKLRGFPYVAHIRLLLEIRSSVFGYLLPLYSRFILGPVLRGAHKIIVLTPAYQAVLHKQFRIPMDKVVVIPNATTFKRLKAPKSELHQVPRLLAVGRLSIQKNYPLMLEVMNLLKTEYKLDFTLTIVGSGFSKKQLQQQARNLGIEQNVRFVGEMTGE